MDVFYAYFAPRNKPKKRYGYCCLPWAPSFNLAKYLAISEKDIPDSGKFDGFLGNFHQFDYMNYQDTAIQVAAIPPYSDRRVSLPDKKTTDNTRNTNAISSFSNVFLFLDRNDVSLHDGGCNGELAPVRGTLGDFPFSGGIDNIDDFGGSYHTERCLLYPSNENLYNTSGYISQTSQECSRTGFNNNSDAFGGDENLVHGSKRPNGETMNSGSPNPRKPRHGC
ncbi:hypothetical protein DL95DRAFT_458272 [Leptodontidium sp. 2 PMI_412]|nr:hypothetical protein DL95DRAFT_458272 [Leptodontidium sp. 2 PMI_412]